MVKAGAAVVGEDCLKAGRFIDGEHSALTAVAEAMFEACPRLIQFGKAPRGDFAEEADEPG